MTLQGFSAQVYRAADCRDCTKGGLSSRYSRCVIVDTAVPGIVTLDPTCEFPVVIKRKGKDYIYAEPLQIDAQCIISGERSKPVAYMMGGNFIYNTDSRFREAYGDRPIPLHDRRE